MTIWIMAQGDPEEKCSVANNPCEMTKIQTAKEADSTQMIMELETYPKVTKREVVSFDYHAFT
jgi:hypothetical protein